MIDLLDLLSLLYPPIFQDLPLHLATQFCRKMTEKEAFSKVGFWIKNTFFNYKIEIEIKTTAATVIKD